MAFLRAREQPEAWDDIARIGDAYVAAASTFAPCLAELTRQLREMDELRHYFQTLHGNGVAELDFARRALGAEQGLTETRDVVAQLSERILQLTRRVEESAIQQASVDAARCAEIKALRVLLETDIDRREQENAVRDGVLGETAKQIDVQVLGDGLSELVRRLGALSQRGFAARWRRWSGG